MVSQDQPLVKAEIRNRIREREKEDPSRYPRDIDAILLEDLEYFLTRDDLYTRFFKSVLEPTFSGQAEVRRILDCLIPTRNKLYHDNHISVREAEKVICYTNDFIDAYKSYYVRLGHEREFNVPTFLSLSDSQGNRLFRTNPDCTWEVLNIHPDRVAERHAIPDAIYTTNRAGDHYEIELEIDSSFSPDAYKVEWIVNFSYDIVLRGEGTTVSIDFTNKMAGFVPEVVIKLITKKDWHRFAYLKCDEKVEIRLNTVLPPIEDTY